MQSSKVPPPPQAAVIDGGIDGGRISFVSGSELETELDEELLLDLLVLVLVARLILEAAGLQFLYYESALG